VVKTKGELYDYLSRRGESLVFINVDNERLMGILPDNVWVAPYSACAENADGCTVGEVVACNPYLLFRWRESDSNLADRGEQPQWYEVQTQLIGSYNIDNMMAAIAVGLNFGVEPSAINRALSAYTPTNNRSQLTVTASNRLVVDAYNANPSSMRAALENFRLMEGSPKMAILGMMGELGASSRKEHQKIVDLIATLELDEVWLVGSEFLSIDGPQVPAASVCATVFRKFSDVEAVKAAIAESRPQGRLILIKGSNSTRLYQLPALL
jgi:UDP-N-acetylmuramoyl-tripeptide--D-alanyl-D-alanine ligase